MKLDSKEILRDLLDWAIRGDLSEREQRNLLEVCASLADETLVEGLMKLAASTRALFEARSRALEVIADRYPEKSVEVTTRLLNNPEPQVRRLALHVAGSDWFRAEPELVRLVCELTQRQEDEGLRRDAQAAMLKLWDLDTGRFPENSVEIANRLLQSPEPEVQRLALHVAGSDWFRAESDLVGVVCKLADPAEKADTDLRRDAQAALLKLWDVSTATARALVRAWLDEPSPTLRNLFVSRLNEVAKQGQHLLDDSARRLEQAFADGDGDADDWRLLGRLRRAGINVSTVRIPFGARVMASLRAKLDPGEIARPTFLRVFVYAGSSALLVVVAMSPLGLNTVIPDEGALFAIWALLLAGALGWTFGRIAVPVALVPDRWSLIPAEVVSAAVLALLPAMAGVLLINLEDYGDWQDRMLFFVLPVVAAFASVRFVSLAAYGLTNVKVLRWRLQAGAAAATGCTVLLLVCLFDPTADSGHEMAMALLFAPVLITMSMVYASIDNGLKDQSAQEGMARRWTVLAPVAIVALLVVLPAVFSVGETAIELRELSADRVANQEPVVRNVPVGTEITLPSSRRQPVTFAAELGGTDIWILVSQGERSVVGDDPDAATMELLPGVVRLCIDVYPQECGAEEGVIDTGLDMLTFARQLADRLRAGVDMGGGRTFGSRLATLTLTGGITPEQAEDLKRYADWLKGLPELPASKEPGYLVASKNVDVSLAAPTEGSVDEQKRAEPAVTEGGTTTPREIVKLAAGTMLYRSVNGDLVVVQGRTSPRTSRLRNAKLPNTVKLLKGRPSATALKGARTTSDALSGPGFESVFNEGLVDLLERDDPAPLEVIEPLLGDRELQLNKAGDTVGMRVLAMSRYSTRGAGVYAVTASESREVLHVKLLYGWNNFGTSLGDCYRLRAEDVIALGREWDSSWRLPVDALRESVAAISGAQHFGKVVSPDTAGECTSMINLSEANVTDLTAAQGEFVHINNIDIYQPERPAILADYFVVVEERGAHEGVLPRGTVVRGLDWDGSDSALFDVVFGYGGICGTPCWVDIMSLTHLGATYERDYDLIPGSFRKRWTVEEATRFEGVELIDNRPLN